MSRLTRAVSFSSSSVAIIGSPPLTNCIVNPSYFPGGDALVHLPEFINSKKNGGLVCPPALLRDLVPPFVGDAMGSFVRYSPTPCVP